MKKKFRDIKLSKTNKERLEVINEIIEEYQEDGYVLTLRQLYYQLVSRDVIPNKVAEYAKLSTLLKEGRMGGIVDWSAIEDRVRVPHIPYFVDDIEDAIEDTVRAYRLDRMRNQNKYIEVWVEKDALSGVLKRVTDEYMVRIMVNRGYSSVSAMHDAYNRINNAIRSGKDVVIIYLGDFDPSGIDMIRDIRDRITEFFGSEDMFTVKPIALTMEQIEKYNPPPNPAKITDPRAKGFIKKNGTSSWEVDALKPEVLNRILTDSIEEEISIPKYEKILQIEAEEREKISELRNFI